MKIAEFIEKNFDLIKEEELGNSGLSGNNLATFKKDIMALEEFKWVRTLNILSSPHFRTYSNGNPRPQYIARIEDTRGVITEKLSVKDKYEIVFRPPPISHRLDDIRIGDFQVHIPANDSVSTVTTILRNDCMLSDTVDLYSISVSAGTVKNEDLNNLGEGIYFLPTTYNPETFTPIKEIRIKINPERRQDDLMDGEEIIDNIADYIKSKMYNLSCCNIPMHYKIMLRVSPRSITDVHNLYTGENITVKIHKKEDDDTINNIFGR